MNGPGPHFWGLLMGKSIARWRAYPSLRQAIREEAKRTQHTVTPAFLRGFFKGYRQECRMIELYPESR